jgi:methylated-DNA-[protein]-cysteine S-methyltransferase
VGVPVDIDERSSLLKKHAVVTSCSIYETAAGFGVLAANEAGLVAHHLPFGAATRADALELIATTHPHSVLGGSVAANGAELMTGYFAGERPIFELPLVLDGFTPFQKEVYRVVAQIPYGKALTYAEVAAACGAPRGARAIGGAMAKNPLPILIPCHRVVGASGVMTGFTAPGGIDSKRELLLMEGCVFNAKGGLQLVLQAGL